MSPIKKEVIIGDCRLLLGDCTHIMPLVGKVDAVVTDPPYGINLNVDGTRFSGGSKKSALKRGEGRKYDAPIINDDKDFDPSHLLIAPLVIIWGWNNFPDKLPKGSALIWIKRNDEAFGSFLSDAEIGWMNKGHGVYCFKDLSNAGIARERVHPTQKPLSLMQWTLAKTKKDSLIIDPYMGSGTTGVACVKLGRKFIGIELNEQYFDIACERIRKAYAQPDMFISAPAPKPVQETMF